MWQVVGEPGDAEQHVTKRGQAGLVLEQGPGGADRADQVAGVGVGEGG